MMREACRAASSLVVHPLKKALEIRKGRIGHFNCILNVSLLSYNPKPSTK